MKRPVKRIKRFAGEEGSQVFSEAQEKWLGGADRTDPYILARMRSAVPDEAKPEAKSAPTPTTIEYSEETGNKGPTAESVNPTKQSFGEAFKSARSSGDSTFMWNGKSYGTKLASETKTAAPKTETKTEPTSNKNDKENPEMVKKAYEDAKKMNADKETTMSKDKTFEDKVADLKAKEVKAKDPYSGDDDFSKRVRELKKKAAEEKNRKTSGYKSGGSVRSSASKRGDGIATKGHTRGKYC